MSLIYGIVLDDNIIEEIVTYVVNSGNYEDYLDEDKTICTERYSDSSNEMVIRFMLSQTDCFVISEIWPEIKIDTFRDICYIGKELWNSFDNEEDKPMVIRDENNNDMIVVATASQTDKILIETDINTVKNCLPSEIETLFPEPSYFFKQ